MSCIGRFFTRSHGSFDLPPSAGEGTISPRNLYETNPTPHFTGANTRIQELQPASNDNEIPPPLPPSRIDKNGRVNTNEPIKIHGQDGKGRQMDLPSIPQPLPSPPINKINNNNFNNSFGKSQKLNDNITQNNIRKGIPPPLPPARKDVTDKGIIDDELPKTPDEIEQNILNQPTKENQRKEGIISDKLNEKNEKEMKIDICEKDEISKELIRKAIVKNDFLNNMMDADRLEAVMLAMKPKTYDIDNFIILEGETGSHFYVSAVGDYQVIKDKKIIKTFGPGVVFGELAILYKAKRFASIKVTTSAKIWSLERKVFQRIMMKTGRQERQENITFLKSVSVLQTLPDNILNQIADLLKREFYATGTTIIQQGDPGDKFYIIRGGSVTVTKRDNVGLERKVGTLKRGDYFGEQALLHKDKRLASIIANEPGTECLTLDRNAFERYLGPLDVIKNKVIVQISIEDAPPVGTIGSVIDIRYKHVKLENLEIVGTLGVGGFGRVELVQYKKGETFALKYLKKIEMVQQQQQEHAYSEKDIMACCDSAFIVKLYNTYRDKKYLYFLMEACLGGDVWTILQKHKYFDEKVSRFMTACVVEAFEYLHTRNMIYRDLKPENLMLDSKGYVKLVDFGFAKRISQTKKTWTFAGTPEYVAPEIILNKGHDRAVDYWALGVFIHELLVGKPPFRGRDHMKTYNLILKGIDIIQMPPRMPKKAESLVKKLCRQVPTERLGYQKDGITDIKKHPWFVGFEWEKLQNLSMPAPLIRPVKNNTDLSNFEDYPRDKDDPPDETSGWDAHF